MSWAHAVVIAVIVFALFWFERQLRIWRWQRARAKNPVPLNVDESTKGFVKGAAQPIICKCGKRTRDFHEYADGDRWCEDCHQGEPQGAVDVRR